MTLRARGRADRSFVRADRQRPLPASPLIGSATTDLPAIFRPGANCWCAPSAARAAVLVDGAAYFSRLEQSLRLAQRSITILGWDFDANIRLCPDKQDEACETLGSLLRNLVEAKPDLEIRVLVWSLSVVHAPSAVLPALFGADWQDHPRIRVHLDTRHPLYGAHHQKVVTIDDAVAFVGGMDLTVDRWDSHDHKAHEPLRRCPDGSSYPAVHDIQMIVDGEAAGAIAELARDRWIEGVGEAVTPVSSVKDPWPPGLEADFTDVPVAISRTRPAWDGHPGWREVETMTIDALKAARRTIYIEAQYFAAAFVGDLLAEHLSRPDGPEIVIIVTHASRSVLEQWVMGTNRDRLVRRLRKADRFDRLRVFYPVVPNDTGECPVLIHSKLLIVDDLFLRVGSANLNNRSMGLDTECDLAIEASTPEARQSIARLRLGLVAEHTGVEEEVVADALADQPFLLAAIEKLNRHRRGLRPFKGLRKSGPTGSVFGTALLDPSGPFWPVKLHRRARARARSTATTS